MAIDVNQAKADYATGASNNAEKLVRKYVAKSGKLEAARSDAAEKLYAAKVSAAIANKSRQKGLAKTNEAEMNAAMQSSGAANYRSGTNRSQDKWARNVQPYIDGLNGLEGRYPAKTADPMANLMNRSGLVVKTMTEIKKRIG